MTVVGKLEQTEYYRQLYRGKCVVLIDTLKESIEQLEEKGVQVTLSIDKDTEDLYHAYECQP